jgi:hypothetical protein
MDVKELILCYEGGGRSELGKERGNKRGELDIATGHVLPESN